MEFGCKAQRHIKSFGKHKTSDLVHGKYITPESITVTVCKSLPLTESNPAPSFQPAGSIENGHPMSAGLPRRARMWRQSRHRSTEPDALCAARRQSSPRTF